MVQAARRISAFALVLVGLLVAGEALANAQQRVVDRARIYVETLLDDEYAKDIGVYVQNAYGVLIVPDMLKGGLILGAEHGVGVLLVRDVQTGQFGPPAFYDLYGVSLGLQIGGQSSDVLLTIMNPGAIERILTSRLKLGADASVAVGRVGAGVGAGTTTRFGEDIYTFARSRGLYGGLSLEGSMVLVKEDWNEAYYGRPVTARAIVERREADNPGSQGLRQALLRF